VTKQTGSALIILLVGLLVTYAPLSVKANPPHMSAMCMDMEKYTEIVSIINPGVGIVRLDQRDITTFQYNYNNKPPVTDFQISGVVFSTKSDTPFVLVAIFIEKCLVVEMPLMPKWIVEVMKPIEGI